MESDTEEYIPEDHASSQSKGERIQLHFKCLNLKSGDFMSQSDVFLVVYMKNGDTQEWEEIHRTATVRNNNSAEFLENLFVSYLFETIQPIKVEAYDRDIFDETNPDYDNLAKADFLGQIQTTLGSILSAKYSMLSSKVMNDSNSKKTKGDITISASVISGNDDIVEFQFRAYDLDRKNFMGMGSSDPFYVLAAQQKDRGNHRLFQSEVRKNTTKPIWKRQRISVARLVNGDLKRQLKIDVFDHESSGKHKIIGSAVTSLAEMKEGMELNLYNFKRKGSSAISGKLVIVHLQYEARASFASYLRGGLQMNLMVGVDMGAGNADLHDLSPDLNMDDLDAGDMNEYMKALYTIGSVLEPYDSDKKIAAFGFAGEHARNSSPFNLGIDEFALEVDGMMGLLRAYVRSATTIKRDKHTRLAPMIRKAIEGSPNSTQNDQRYNVLLLLTHGAIIDLDDAISAVIDASDRPLSIILIGMGDPDETNHLFRDMEVLDNDEVEKPLTANGKTALRDIVQFVPFREFLYHNDFKALSKETLAELPEQVTRYFNLKRIKPNVPMSG